MGHSTVSISDANFKSQVLESKGLVLVDFWAEWCGPCRALGPKLEEIAAELKDQVVIGKVNVEENPETPSQYGVRGIPTMILFKDGQPIETLVGDRPKEAILSVLQKQMSR